MNNSFFKSFVYAAKGIVSTAKLGFNFKAMLALALCAIVLGFFFSISITEWIIVSLCIGLVLGAECINTAIENTVDLISPHYNKYAGIAKDCAAGGVLLLSLASFVIALLIFIPKLVDMLF